ncbi:MAG: RibD family protein [Pseudomonadota bacterium]
MAPLYPWTADAWAAVLQASAPGKAETAPPSTPKDGGLAALYHPLMMARAQGRPLCLGQLGQSLDGRIATESGHSHYINGPAALTHLHALRALVDAVVVGVGTALADDPRLTVRLLEGPSPARVVIDPHGRLPASARCWQDDGCRQVLIHAGSAVVPPGVTSLVVPQYAGQFHPLDLVRALQDLGLKRLLIEGGAGTLSAFLQAGALDRLHVLTGPLIIGSGTPGLTLPAIDRLDQALRPEVSVHPLPGGDCLFDCAFVSGTHGA